MNLQSLMGPGAWEHYRPAAPDPQKIRWLTCACCGSEVRGRQWSNRDTGYGVCVRCADANTAEYGEGDESNGQRDSTTRALYGARGVHFGIANAVPMGAGRRQIREVTDDTDMCNGCEDNCEDCASNAVCVMDWNRCTEKFCDLHASGCPHFTEEES